MLRVNERSAQSFTVNFYDSDGVAVEPGTVRWRLKNLTTSEVISDWTEVEPDTSITITTTAAMNTSRSRGRYDDMELVVQRDYDDTTIQRSQSFRYRINNLPAVDD